MKKAFLLLAIVLVAVPSFAMEKTALLRWGGPLFLAGISDDGNKIVYIADTDTNPATKWDREVFVIDRETRNVTRITRDLDEEMQAGISGNGAGVVYAKKTTENGVTFVDYYLQGIPPSSPRLLKRMPLSDTNHPYTNRVLMSVVSYQYSIIFKIPSYVYYINMYYDRPVESSPYLYPAPDRKGSYMVMSKKLGDRRYGLFLKTVGGRDTTTIFETQEGEIPFVKWCGWRRCYLSSKSPFSVSYDGKVVFTIYPVNDSVRGIRKGMFVYYNGNTEKISDRLPWVVRITGDGNKIFYIERINTRLYRLSSMNFDGSNNEVIDEFSSEGVPEMFVNNDGSVVVVGYRRGERPYYWTIEEYHIPRVSERIPQGRRLPSNEIADIIRTGFESNLNPPFSLNDTVIEVGSATISEDDRVVQIPVSIRNAKNLGAMNLVISYPSNHLRVEDVMTGSLTQESMFEHNEAGNNISIGIVDSEGLNGEGSLFHISFRIFNITNTTSDEFDITISYAEASDVDGNPIPLVTIPGTISFVSNETEIRGDVNGDGRVTSIDALLALQMSVGKIEKNDRADMNEDEKITAEDALEILKIATSIPEIGMNLGRKFGNRGRLKI